jgi:hypothetical protein
VETWRIIATALFAAGGLVLVPVIMAKVRERTPSGGQVAIAGVVGMTAVLVVGIVMLTVLAQPVAWGIVVVVGGAATVMALAS